MRDIEFHTGTHYLTAVFSDGNEPPEASVHSPSASSSISSDAVNLHERLTRPRRGPLPLPSPRIVFEAPPFMISVLGMPVVHPTASLVVQRSSLPRWSWSHRGHTIVRPRPNVEAAFPPFDWSAGKRPTTNVDGTPLTDLRRLPNLMSRPRRPACGGAVGCSKVIFTPCLRPSRVHSASRPGGAPLVWGDVRVGSPASVDHGGAESDCSPRVIGATRAGWSRATPENRVDFRCDRTSGTSLDIDSFTRADTAPLTLSGTGRRLQHRFTIVSGPRPMPSLPGANEGCGPRCVFFSPTI